MKGSVSMSNASGLLLKRVSTCPGQQKQEADQGGIPPRRYSPTPDA